MTKEMQVAVTGSTGQLGRALVAAAPKDWRIIGLTREIADVSNWPAVRDWIAFEQPTLVIHAAAATDVDGCERDPHSAYRINALGTRNVAAAAARVGAALMYISTNFVFDGEKDDPYHESDETNPISVYGASKLAGEREAISACPGAHIIRTSMVFDREGRNFVNTILRLMSERDRISVVGDQYGNPTYAPDLAAALIKVIQSAPPGTYHVTNSGEASWHQWAAEIARVTALDTIVEEISWREFERAAMPPRDGRMSSLVLSDFDIRLPHWKDALGRCLEQ